MKVDSAGYSANVEMYLVLADRQLELAQLGPEHCILRNSESFPSTSGEIVLIVDGHETRVPAYFSEGATSESRRVPYIRISAPTLAAAPGAR